MCFGIPHGLPRKLQRQFFVDAWHRDSLQWSIHAASKPETCPTSLVSSWGLWITCCVGCVESGRHSDNLPYIVHERAGRGPQLEFVKIVYIYGISTSEWRSTFFRRRPRSSLPWSPRNGPKATLAGPPNFGFSWIVSKLHVYLYQPAFQ